MRLFRGTPVLRTSPIVFSSIACILLTVGGARAACQGCVTFNAGIPWGTNTFTQLNEASGLAVSTRNPGVVWSHNDDGDDDDGVGRLFAFRTNGIALARYRMNIQLLGHTLRDIEDMAIGPGPTAGAQYLYVGDIGGDLSVRNELRIVRIPEPTVIPSSSALDFAGVQVFIVKYPFNHFWDAETLLVDPLNGDIYVGTKHESAGTWLYRVNLNGAAPGSTNTMEFVRTVPFYDASGGTISPDGGQIALRSEFFAQTWQRCFGESISNAFSRAGQSIPLSFTEINGEAIAFLPNNRGYITVSDSVQEPPIHYFSPTCAPTLITQNPQSMTVSVGANAMFHSEASGENLGYQWLFNNAELPGQTSDTLFLTDVQPSDSGPYKLRASGNGGVATSADAVLSVAILPPVIGSQPPLNTLAPTGSTVQLTVGVAGTPPLHYSWSFGRKLLSQNSPTLTLTNVQRANSGKYRVTVTNSVGKALSSYATLKVLSPPIIAGQPLSRTNRVNTTAALRVRAKGSPRLSYRWFYEGVAISNATRSALSLPRVQPAQSGQYHVVITNSVGSVTSAPAILTVP